MKAERIKQKQEFVPVIVTLESQEEVDALFAVGNDIRMCSALPALNEMYNALKHFRSGHFGDSWDRLNGVIVN